MKQGWRWFFSGILLGALLLRLPFLNGSFWLDEAAQALESTRPWYQQFELAADFQPPVFHLWVFLFGLVSHAEWWLRLSSLIPAILSLALFLLLLRKYASFEQATLGGVLLASSSLHVFFSQELRPYMLACLWAMVSWYAWMEWLELSPSRLKKWWAVLLVGAISAGVLTSFVFLFWVIGLWITTMLWYPRLRLPLTKLFSVSGLFAMSWYPWFLEQWRVGQSLRETMPGWEAVVSAPALKALLLVPTKFLVGVVEIDLYSFDLITVGVPLVLWVTLIVAGVWQEYQTPSKSRLVSVWSSLLLITFSLAAVATAFTPVLAPKRILFLLPLAIACLVGVRFVGRWRTVQNVALSFVFVWQLWSLSQYWTQAQLQRENWRELSFSIESRFSPTSTALVFAFDDAFAPWRWYSRQEWKTYTTGLAPVGDTEKTTGQLQGIESYDYVLLFDYLRDLTDPENRLPEIIQSAGFQEIGALEQPNIGFVRVFARSTLYAGK